MNIAVPAVTATIGVAGGVLLARTALQRNRKLLGIPVPKTKIDLAGVSQQIGEAVTPPAPPGVPTIARRVARKVLKKLGSKAAQAGARAIRAAADRTASAGKGALESGLSRRLPIQVSVDVPVPIHFAWNEWMLFDFFTEGVDRIEDVERDGWSGVEDRRTAIERLDDPLSVSARACGRSRISCVVR